MKKYKIKSRFFYIVVTTLLLIFCFFSIAQRETEKQEKIEQLKKCNDYIVEIVQNGGTLWGYCTKHKPQAVNIWEYMQIVEDINGIDCNEFLQIGDCLKLPQ